jgi:hypothetical protein
VRLLNPRARCRCTWCSRSGRHKYTGLRRDACERDCPGLCCPWWCIAQGECVRTRGKIQPSTSPTGIICREVNLGVKLQLRACLALEHPQDLEGVGVWRAPPHLPVPPRGRWHWQLLVTRAALPRLPPLTPPPPGTPPHLGSRNMQRLKSKLQEMVKNNLSPTTHTTSAPHLFACFDAMTRRKLQSPIKQPCVPRPATRWRCTSPVLRQSWPWVPPQASLICMPKFGRTLPSPPTPR